MQLFQPGEERATVTAQSSFEGVMRAFGHAAPKIPGGEAEQPPGVERGRKPVVPAAPNAKLRAAAASWIFSRAAARVPIRILESNSAVRDDAASNELCMTISEPKQFYRRLGTMGLIGFGESYQACEWDANDLPGLLTALFSYTDGRLTSFTRRLRRHIGVQRPQIEENTASGSRRNISHHYDVSNDLFRLILGESMTYSAAIFPTDSNGGPVARLELLSESQTRKIDRLLDLAGVRNGTKLLEVGTGWGELAMRAARRGAFVRTITLSAEQQAFAQQRISAAGLGDRVIVELRDYRELQNEPTRYDAIISVEMVEAIGSKYWPTYFRLLNALLSPNGRVGLQIITMRHDRFLVAQHTQSWVNRYVLPGFLLPSTIAIERSIRENTDLQIVDQMAFGAHYAATLALWRENFVSNAGQIDELGFDEIFFRTWLFFLSSSEAGFRAGLFDVYHYVLGHVEEHRP